VLRTRNRNRSRHHSRSTITTLLAEAEMWLEADQIANTLIIEDTFTRANSTTTMGEPERGYNPDYAEYRWKVSGTWGVSSNRGYCVSGADDTRALVVPRFPDYTVAATLTGVWDATHHNTLCLVARADGSFTNPGAANIYLFAGIDSAGVPRLWGRSGASTAVIASGTLPGGVTSGQPYTSTLTVAGNEVTVTIANTTVISHTLTGGDATAYNAWEQLNGTNSAAGLHVHASGGISGGPPTADNFTVTIGALVDGQDIDALPPLGNSLRRPGNRADWIADGTPSHLPTWRYLGASGSWQSFGGTQTSLHWLHDGTNHTVFIVAKSTDAAPADNMSLMTNSTFSSDRTGYGLLVLTDGRINKSITKSSTGNSVVSCQAAAGSFPFQEWNIVEDVCSFSASSNLLLVNGVQVASATPANLPPSTGDPTFNLVLGTNSSRTGSFFGGDYYAVLAWPRALSPAERELVRTYLASKVGVTI